MDQKCIDIENLAEILELPDDDPRRRHLEECPRCSSILLSFQAFLEAEKVPGSDPVDAETRLGEFIKASIDKQSPGTSERVVVEERPGFLSEFLQGLFRRPVWVTAALLIVAAGMLWWKPWVEDPLVLRGTIPAETKSPLELAAPQALDDGSLLLSWSPFDSVDIYEVRLYDESLSELARFGPLTETTLVLTRSMLPEDAPSAMLWRVVALDEGDEVAASRPAPFSF